MNIPLIELAFYKLAAVAECELSRYGCWKVKTEHQVVAILSLYREWEQFAGLWQTVANLSPAAYVETAVPHETKSYNLNEGARRIYVPESLLNVPAGAI